MQQRFPLPGGSLTCRADDTCAELCLELRPAHEGRWRGFVLGRSGGMELGPLGPEDGCLRLRRSVPLAKLRAHGCWPITGGRIEPVREAAPARETAPNREAGPARESAPPPRDRPRAAHGGRPAADGTVILGADGWRLSFPFDPRRPFPLPALFCCAAVAEGRVVFRFAADGTPLIARPP